MQSFLSKHWGLPNAKGAPQPMAHPTAMSAALPVASCKKDNSRAKHSNLISSNDSTQVYDAKDDSGEGLR